MHPETREKLLAINRQFYERSASSFSLTRKKLQPGVKRLLAEVPPRTDILDLGCGNGNFALALAKTAYAGRYLGIDASTMEANAAMAKGSVACAK